MMHAIQNAAPAPDAAANLLPYLQYGIAGIALGVLVFVVRVLRETHKEASERQAAAARDEAQRTAQQNTECALRTQQTVATIDNICDRFGETQTVTAQTFATSIEKMQEAQNNAQREQREAYAALVREVLQHRT